MKPPVFHRVFDYNRDLIPNRHLASLDDEVRSIEDARQKTGASIGYPGWGLIYHLLLCHLDRDREEIIVETGTNWGSTTIIIAQALIDAGCRGKVLTFELDNENVAKAKENFACGSVESRIEVIHGDSRVKLPETLNTVCPLKSIRFAFLDASHAEADMLSEFESLLPYLTHDALVAFDNTYCIALPGEDQLVNGALKKIAGRYGGNLINLEFVSWYTPGFAIWQKAPNL